MSRPAGPASGPPPNCPMASRPKWAGRSHYTWWRSRYVPHRSEETAAIAGEGSRSRERSRPSRPRAASTYSDALRQQHRDARQRPHILVNGAEWFQGLGMRRPPARSSTPSAAMCFRPASTRSPMGTSLREARLRHRRRHAPRIAKAVFTGGPSNTILSIDELPSNIALDWGRRSPLTTVDCGAGDDRRVRGDVDGPPGGGVRRLLRCGSSANAPRAASEPADGTTTSPHRTRAADPEDVDHLEEPVRRAPWQWEMWPRRWHSDPSVEPARQVPQQVRDALKR